MQTSDGNGNWGDVRGHLIFNMPPDRYRIKPEPGMVPLGPEDVPVGSVIRCIEGPCKSVDGWAAILSVEKYGMCITGQSNRTILFSWDHLMEHSEIKRPGQDWQPCHKPAA